MNKAVSKTMHKSFLVKRNVNYGAMSESLIKPRQFLKFKRLHRLKPATLAVLVQCLAFAAVLTVLQIQHFIFVAGIKTELYFSIVDLVIMQALFATTFSYFLNMAIWWRWIHLCFPIIVLAMYRWQLPNEFYLAGFVINLSLFWTTFRSQVPFFPSRPAVWKQVAKLMPKDKSVRLIDIGSGLGDMPMYIAKVRPDSLIEGVEIAPLPWLISLVRGKISRSKVTFKLGDYRAIDFANYDVIFAYLSPAAMLALWDKASLEMRPGSLLISLEFEIPGASPSMRIAGSENSPAIYVWQI
jgi:hypothetical protein